MTEVEKAILDIIRLIGCVWWIIKLIIKPTCTQAYDISISNRYFDIFDIAYQSITTLEPWCTVVRSGYCSQLRHHCRGQPALLSASRLACCSAVHNSAPKQTARGSRMWSVCARDSNNIGVSSLHWYLALTGYYIVELHWVNSTVILFFSQMAPLQRCW